MFITVYGKYGPQPPKNHVINTNLIQKIQTYQPLFGKEKYYDIWVQTDGYGPNMFTGYQDRRQRSFVTQLG